MQIATEPIERICEALADDDLARAATIAKQEIPFEPILGSRRSYSYVDQVGVFIRDGFLDRYSGTRLVFPAVLRLLSELLPSEIPYHRNWKTTDCHFLFWHLSPTIDHVVPVGRGGADVAENWVCTSMLRNSAKAHWTLEELGWELIPRGSFDEWDGMLRWYIEYVERDSSVLSSRYQKRWHNAALQALADLRTAT